MDLFSPGDRVVAINIDISAPIHPDRDCSLHPFRFLGGPLRRGQVYHVEAVQNMTNGRQGLFLTGIRIAWGDLDDIPWDSSRFRKAATIRHRATRKRRIRQPLSLPRITDHRPVPA